MGTEYKLVVTPGDKEAFGVTLSTNGADVISFGRDDSNDIVFPVPTVSSFHGCFYVVDQDLAMWDFGSKNGLFVNGGRVNVNARLSSGDTVHLCPPGTRPDMAVTIKISDNLANTPETMVTEVFVKERRPKATALVLTGVSGHFAQKSFKFQQNERVAMGNDASKCALAYPPDAGHISGVHCVISFSNALNSFVLLDQNSEEGTFVDDGKRLPPQSLYPLKNGAGFYLAVADQKFTVQIVSVNDEPAAATAATDVATEAVKEAVTEVSGETAKESANEAIKEAPQELESNELFPAGHKRYEILYEPGDPKLVYNKKYACRMCENEFTAPTVTSSARLERSDNDFRLHHINVDTLYYRVVTCPDCLHSALSESFTQVLSTKYDAMVAEIEQYRDLLTISNDRNRDVDGLFTAMYVALKCAKTCRVRPEMPVAKLWLAISWLYGECEDADMEAFATKQALTAYLHLYENITVADDQIQQLQLIIGELAFRLGDREMARRFLAMVKLSRGGSSALKQKADERLEDMKKF